MRVISVNVGNRKPVAGPGEPLESAIDRHPVAGPVRLSSTGLAGDEQVHTKSHGGPERALLFFSEENAKEFALRLGRPLPPGSFGENVRVEGCDEREVRIGDVFRWGHVEVQATSARMPCGILARHLRAPDIVEEIGRPHRAGWYVRVLSEGMVRAEDPIAIVARGAAQWPIERAAAVFAAKDDVVGARALLGAPGLSSSWRERLLKRLDGRA
jgi:MOSC domain-containing protein YiiM